MNNIIRIYFFNNDLEHAAVFFKDKKTGEYKAKMYDAETAKTMLKKYAKDNYYNNLDELRDDKIYEIISSDELKEKLRTLRDEMENKEDDDFLDEDDDFDLSDVVSNLVNKIKEININKLKIKKTGIAILLVAGGIVITSGIYSITKKSKKKVSTDFQATTESTTSDILEEKARYSTVDELLDVAAINENKKAAITNTWNYISYYNDTIASKHLGSDGTRLAHSWEEVMVNYLIYNNISEDEAKDIFDNSKLDAATLKEAYLSSIDQAMLAYTVITEPSYKDSLIKSETGKNFYNRYEDLIIRFNKNKGDMEAKEKIAKEFYSKVYLDFFNGEEMTISDNYKLSVIPIIKTFNSLTEEVNCDIKLSKEDEKQLDTLAGIDNVSNYIETICNAVNRHNIETTDECTYAQISDLAIEELSDEGLYNISMDSRNISSSQEYKSAFESSDTEEKADATTQEEIVNNTKNENNSSNNNTNNDNTAGEVPDEEADKVPKWLTKKNKQKEITTTTEVENNVDSNVETTTEATTNSDIDDSAGEDVPEVEEDTPDMSFFESSYNDFNNSDSSRQAYYQKIADKIIESMSNEKETVKAEKQKTYTK